MKTACEEIQEKLAIEGIVTMKNDAEAYDHCAECEECFSYFDALRSLEALSSDDSSYDAPDPVVRRLLEAVREHPVRPHSQLHEVSPFPFCSLDSMLGRAAAAAAFGLALGVAAVLVSPPQRILIVQAAGKAAPNASSTEQYQELITAFSRDIQRAKEESATMALARVNTDGKNNAESKTSVRERVTPSVPGEYHWTTLELKQAIPSSSSKIFNSLVDKFEHLQREVDELTEQLQNDKSTLSSRSPERDALRSHAITPGDSVDVELLTPVAAPTDGAAGAGVFRLVSAIEGPDGSTLPLTDATVTAAAQGSELDQRAMFRLTELSFRGGDGTIVRTKVDGWIVGEDGVRGINGSVVPRVSPESVSAPRILEASRRTGEVLNPREQSLAPIINVAAGQTAVAIFSQPVELPNVVAQAEGQRGAALFTLLGSLDALAKEALKQPPPLRMELERF